MNMTRGSPVAVGTLALVCSLVACSSDERGTASCSLPAAITFDGREYIAVNSLPGLERKEVRAGKLLGVGYAATCTGESAQQVQVYKVVGVPVGTAVVSRPEFGLMERWNLDGAIK